MKRGTDSDKKQNRKRSGQMGPNSLLRMRKEHIERALCTVGNDLEKAAAVLDISVGELRKLMRELGIPGG